MQSENAESEPKLSKGRPPSEAPYLDLGYSVDFAVIESTQCRFSLSLKFHVQNFFRNSPVRVVAIPGPKQQIFLLREGNPLLRRFTEKVQVDPENPFSLEQLLQMPSTRAASLVQPVSCSYKSNRAILSFPPPLWKGGFAPSPALFGDEQSRKVAVVASKDFLEVWRFNIWSDNMARDLVPIWEAILTEED